MKYIGTDKLSQENDLCPREATWTSVYLHEQYEHWIIGWYRDKEERRQSPSREFLQGMCFSSIKRTRGPVFSRRMNDEASWRRSRVNGTSFTAYSLRKRCKETRNGRAKVSQTSCNIPTRVRVRKVIYGTGPSYDIYKPVPRKGSLYTNICHCCSVCMKDRRCSLIDTLLTGNREVLWSFCLGILVLRFWFLGCWIVVAWLLSLNFLIPRPGFSLSWSSFLGFLTFGIYNVKSLTSLLRIWLLI